MRDGVEQRDAPDERRLEATGSNMVGTVIVNEGKVVRASRLIASVRRTEAAQQRDAARRAYWGDRGRAASQRGIGPCDTRASS